MENVLLTIHLLIAIALVGVILLQKSEGGALGIGGSSNQFGIFTAKGSANFLTRLTAILATCFIATSLLLTIIQARTNNQETVILEQLQQESENLQEELPVEPAVPLSN